jgi:glycosyltransferase involved in cell wall biosynthesis
VTPILDRVDEANGRKLMLLATTLTQGGGAEVQVVEMAVALKQRGWDVEIVSMLTPRPPAPDLTGYGIPIHSLEMRRGIGDPGAVLRLRNLVRQIRPDVVHSHMTHANLLARVTRLFVKMPVLVCTLHGYKMYSVKSTGTGLREGAHRLTDGLADMTTVVCHAAADRYARKRVAQPDKLRVVPNGVRTSIYRPNDASRAMMRRKLNLRDEFVWLAAGRLEMVKDYGTMLRAFAKLVDQDGRQVLLVAGEGSLLGSLERMAEDLGIAPNVRFLGYRADIADLMRASDAYVLSSIFEGMPLALLEAGASELPVVATRVGGNAEAMVEGRSGFLVPSRHVGDLACAMERVLGMPFEERRAMGRTGGEFVRSEYSLDAVMEKWEGLYAELLGEQKAGVQSRDAEGTRTAQVELNRV